MNSVLLIGNRSFTTSVIAQVRGLDALTLTTVTNALEALQFMENTTPDVVITQAQQLLDGSISKTFHQERHSIYFVVVEDSLLSSTKTAAETATKTAAKTATKTAAKMVLISPLCEMHLEKTASALEAGADAYLWLPPYPSSAIPITTVQPAENSAARSSANGGQNNSQNSSQNGSQNSSQNGSQNSSQNGSQNGSEVSHPSAHPSTHPSAYQDLSALPTVFHRSQSRLIQAHIQIGLNRAQRYRDLSRINDWLSAVALVDALTQLSNRRAFDLELPRQVKVSRTKGTPLSIMVLDIDFFKSVNDRYGHLVGDDVLKLLAKRLLANMRFYDAPFRYGGEEFVITLSNTDLQEGLAIAERLRRSIAQTPFKLLSVIENSGQLPITVSIGLTELRADDDEQGRSFLHRADQQLLKAKGAGRNRVVSDPKTGGLS
jgi:diguanylate cyclase (GGDEF)-like protein